MADVELAKAAVCGGDIVSINADHAGKGSGYLAEPEDKNAPTMIVVHAWWELNDHIKVVAQEFKAKGFRPIAIDLFKGSFASDRDGAMAQIKARNSDEATHAMKAWVDWARQQGNGKVGTCGWCFGGGWSLQAALSAGPDASIIYYGRVGESASDIERLNTPLLGHFGTLDERINPKMVGAFQQTLREIGKDDLLTTHWYTANYAFANPTGGRYDEDDAAMPLARTLTFLEAHLRG